MTLLDRTVVVLAGVLAACGASAPAFHDAPEHRACRLLAVDGAGKSVDAPRPPGATSAETCSATRDGATVSLHVTQYAGGGASARTFRESACHRDGRASRITVRGVDVCLRSHYDAIVLIEPVPAASLAVVADLPPNEAEALVGTVILRARVDGNWGFPDVRLTALDVVTTAVRRLR